MILGDRNGYSKTDPDACMMMMKNGHLRPGYNVLIGTQNQFIVNFDVTQNANDAVCFPSLMSGVDCFNGGMPVNVVGDAGFGTEENYKYCEIHDMEAYLKYSAYHNQKTKKFRENRFKKENMPYDANLDCYTCPMGKVIEFKREDIRTTATGYEKTVRTYAAKECGGCPVKSECTKGENRVIARSDEYDRQTSKARSLLDSGEGKKKRKQRSVDVETPFGNIKWNHNLTRFLLRSLPKVKIETGLLAIAHNIRKIGNALASAISEVAALSWDLG